MKVIFFNLLTFTSCVRYRFSKSGVSTCIVMLEDGFWKCKIVLRNGSQCYHLFGCVELVLHFSTFCLLMVLYSLFLFLTSVGRLGWKHNVVNQFHYMHNPHMIHNFCNPFIGFLTISSSSLILIFETIYIWFNHLVYIYKSIKMVYWNICEIFFTIIYLLSNHNYV
jgi:hypothetical protein